MVPIQDFVNFLLLFLLSFLLFYLNKRFNSGKLLFKIFCGIIVAFFSYLSILFPVTVPSGFSITIIVVTIPLATLFFGYLTGLVSIIILEALIFSFGNTNVLLTELLLITYFLLGSAAKIYKEKKGHEKNTLFHFYIFGLGIGLASSIITYFFLHDKSLTSIANLLIFYVGTVPLVFVILGYFYLGGEERELSLKKLFRMQGRYKLIAENISEVITLLDFDFNIIFISPSIESMLGYSYKELLGKNVSEVVTPDSIKSAKELLNKEMNLVLQSKGEFEIKRKIILEQIKIDGTHIFVENSASLIFDEKGNPKYILVIARDVTEQLKLQEELQQSEEKFKKIFQTIPDPVTITSIEDGTYLEVNKAFEETTGYNRDEVIGKSALDLHIWENEKDRGKLLKELKEKGEVGGLEVKFKMQDGRVIDALIAGSYIKIGSEKYLLLISKEITELKNAIRDARISEANLTSLINNGDESIWSLDTNLNYIVFNNKFKNDFWEAHNIELKKGLNALDILNIEGRTFWKCKYDDVLSGKKLGFIYTKVVKGKTYHMNVFLSPILEEGEITGITAIALDITEKREAEIAHEESEKRYRAMFELNRAPMIIVDGETGYIVDVNDAAVNLYGYEKKNLLRMNIAEINTMEENAISEEIQAAIGGKSIHNFLIRTGTGLLKHVEVYSSPIEIKGEKYIYAIVNDVTEKIESQIALKESEEKFRLTFNTMMDAILITDVETGKFIDVNKGFEQLTGYSKEEIEGKSILDISLWKDNSVREVIVKEVKEKGFAYNFESQFVRKDGKVVVGLLSVSTISIKQKPHLLTVARDITELREADKKLRESERRYRNIFEKSKAVLLLVDVETQKIIDANDSAVEFYGWSREKLLNMKINEIAILSRERINNNISMVENKGKNFFSLTHRTANNTMKDVEVYLTPIVIEGRKALFSIINDVTYKRQKEAQLEEYRNLLELSQKIAVMGSWKLDLVNDDLYWSDEVYSIFGYKPQEFKATYEAFLEAVYPDDRELVNTAYLTSIKNNEDAYQIEHRIVRKDTGEVRNVFERCLHYRDEQGDITYSVGIVLDITERKKAEIKLKDLMGRLINSEEEMRKNVSIELHDEVGQSLTALSINLNELMLNVKKGNINLEHISRSVDGSLNILDAVSEKIRNVMTELRPTILDDYGLNAAIRWAVEKTRKTLNIDMFYEGRDLQNELPIDVSYTVLRVVQEALHNIQKHAEATKISAVLIEDDDNIIIKIKDNGKGFNKEGIDRIRKNKGFGLVSMQERINIIKGELKIESVPGEGTEVIIILNKSAYEK